MEDAASGNDLLLLQRLRALARRGVTLRRLADGTGNIEQVESSRTPQVLSPLEVIELIDRGWLRPLAAELFVVSRRGLAALRSHLNRPTGISPPKRPGAVPVTHTKSTPRTPTKPNVNDRESPLAWLRQRRDKSGKTLIGATDFEAGERLRADFERAHLNPRVTASWDPTALPGRQSRGAPGVGMELSEGVLAAKQRVDAALKAVGPELSGMLLDVCCFLKGLEQAERNGGWPRRSGKVVLQLGLAHLARHYGLERVERRGPGKIRAWGAPGYRPGMDSDEAA